MHLGNGTYNATGAPACSLWGNGYWEFCISCSIGLLHSFTSDLSGKILGVFAFLNSPKMFSYWTYVCAHCAFHGAAGPGDLLSALRSSMRGGLLCHSFSDVLGSEPRGGFLVLLLPAMLLGTSLSTCSGAHMKVPCIGKHTVSCSHRKKGRKFLAGVGLGVDYAPSTLVQNDKMVFNVVATVYTPSSTAWESQFSHSSANTRDFWT